MTNKTVVCIYKHAVPGNEDLTPNEVILACDSNGILKKDRGRTIHLDGSRSNEASFRLWCQNPTMWMLSPDGIRYRKKMNAWNLREYWGNDIPFEHIDKPDPDVPIGLGNQPAITPEIKDKYGNWFLIALLSVFGIIGWLLLMGPIRSG